MMVLCQSHRHDFQGPRALGKVKIDNICYWSFLYFPLYTFFPLLASLCLYTQGPQKKIYIQTVYRLEWKGDFYPGLLPLKMAPKSRLLLPSCTCATELN